MHDTTPSPGLRCAPPPSLVGPHSVNGALELSARLGMATLARRGLWIGTVAAMRVYRAHRVIELAEFSREGQGLCLALPNSLLCSARAQAWRSLLLDPPPQPVRVCFIGRFAGTPCAASLEAEVWRCGHLWLSASWRSGAAAQTWTDARSQPLTQV